jgi:hypothetical protein
MCLYQPATMPSFDGGGAGWAQLDFQLRDSLNGRLLDEVGPWCLELEIVVTH